jgi:hypothetical protein
MAIYRFWQHESGALYAVEMSDQGEIMGMCGPIDYSERDKPMNEFEYESEDVDWMIDNSYSFRDVTTPAEEARQRS